MTFRVSVDDEARGQLRGRDVFVAIAAFFGVIIAVNGYFLYVALSSHSGVVAVEPYRKGLAYNDRIAADERQMLLGWSVALEVERSGQLRLALTDRNDTPVSGVIISGTVGRPATGASDQSVALREIAPGRYGASVAELGAGSWIVSLDVIDRQIGVSPVYRLRRRVWLKP